MGINLAKSPEQFMKKNIIFVLILLKGISNVFAVSDNLDFIGVFERVNFALKVKEEICFLQPELLNAKEPREIVNEHYVLYSDGKYIFYNPKAPNNLTLYDIGEYRVDLIDDVRLANIFPADSPDFFDLSLYNIVALTIDPRSILANVYKYVQEKDGIDITTSCLTFSCGSYTYVVYSDKKKINQFDVMKNSSGELFIRAIFLPKNNTMPFKVKVDYFYKNKSVIRKTYTFILTSKNVPNNIYECFNVKGLGSYKFIDMRFNPAKNYNCENGIPTMEEAKYLENIVKIPDMSSTSINERNSKLNTGSQSNLLRNAKEIISEIF